MSTPKNSNARASRKEANMLSPRIEPQAASSVPAALDITGYKYEFELVYNQPGKPGNEENMLKLVDIKNIFARQLPKMPKEYMSRLVFDGNHASLLMYRKKEESSLIGGCCFRPFKERGFAEIVFLAVNQYEQVKGHGTRIMNGLKELMRYCGFLYLLTFADNHATGYFQKQGFTKYIALRKERYMHFIKNYEGACCMGCRIYPQVGYSDVLSVLKEQRKAVQQIIEQINDLPVHKGLPENKFPLRDPLKDIPGMSAVVAEMESMNTLIPGGYCTAGESLTDCFKTQWNLSRSRNTLNWQIQNCIDAGARTNYAGPFKEPVGKVFKNYSQFVSTPMDLATMRFKLGLNEYRSISHFKEDCQLLIDNSIRFNGPSHPVTAQARKLVEAMFKKAPADYCSQPQIPRGDLLPPQRPDHPADDS